MLLVHHLINRTPTPLLQNKTPFELLFNHPPSFDAICTIGCYCFAHNHKTTGDKFAILLVRRVGGYMISLQKNSLFPETLNLLRMCSHLLPPSNLLCPKMALSTPILMMTSLQLFLIQLRILRHLTQLLCQLHRLPSLIRGGCVIY